MPNGRLYAFLALSGGISPHLIPRYRTRASIRALGLDWERGPMFAVQGVSVPRDRDADMHLCSLDVRDPLPKWERQTLVQKLDALSRPAPPNLTQPMDQALKPSTASPPAFAPPTPFERPKPPPFEIPDGISPENQVPAENMPAAALEPQWPKTIETLTATMQSLVQGLVPGAGVASEQTEGDGTEAGDGTNGPHKLSMCEYHSNVGDVGLCAVQGLSHTLDLAQNVALVLKSNTRILAGGQKALTGLLQLLSIMEAPGSRTAMKFLGTELVTTLLARKEPTPDYLRGLCLQVQAAITHLPAAVSIDDAATGSFHHVNLALPSSAEPARAEREFQASISHNTETLLESVPG